MDNVKEKKAIELYHESFKIATRQLTCLQGEKLRSYECYHEPKIPSTFFLCRQFFTVDTPPASSKLCLL